MTEQHRQEPDELTPEEARSVVKAIEETEREEAEAQARKAESDGQ